MVSTLVVNDAGTELSYVDSGAPSKSVYITVFAVHGMVFTSPVFQKVQGLALKAGLRFVAINRRNYPGSSPFTPDELNVIMQGTDEQKDAYMKARGHEIATFIDLFVQKHNLPPISDDGKTGGVVILGWSLGNSMSMASIANLDTLPTDVQSRFASRVRTLIMHGSFFLMLNLPMHIVLPDIPEPSPIILGLPSPPQHWAPLLNTSMPEELRVPAFTQWITGYFQHGDLSKRDLNDLSYVLHATFRPPTIFNMSAEQYKDIVSEGPNAAVDTPFMVNFIPQLLASYRKTCYDGSVRTSLPKMKVWFLTGDMTASLGPAALWAVEDDDKERGGGFVTCKMIPGANHFVHWDDPEVTLKVYLECIMG
ncbi:hypothetical protein EW146_g7663 [Bondarzewia mesenterica]|uniref:AB hydrolase-1 domain-containing protein n=1 Tax=Bondarzewia mesenterica TaxID=1095465 RepID=A0A4S4LK56_9AGAM|nr:hypothetical protein EW146_g7663 [Bondarzewia mesenterica]